MGAPEDRHFVVSPFGTIPTPLESLHRFGVHFSSKREGCKEALLFQGPGRLPRERQEDKVLPLNRLFSLIGAIIPNPGHLLCDRRDLVLPPGDFLV